jgi:hypothetical protein
MRFTPKTKEEINESKLYPEGEYSFEVYQVVEAVSKNGNDMLKVMLRVYKPDGTFIFVTDYLMESVMYKLLHFCEATGLEDLYHTGTINADDTGVVQEFTGKTGTLKLGIQKSADYPDRNVVKDYLPTPEAKTARPAVKQTIKKASAAAQAPIDDMDDSDIPF